MPEGMQRTIRDKSKPRLLSRALHSKRTWYGLSDPVWHIVHLAFPMFCCMPLGCPPMSSAITFDTMGIKLGFLATNIHQGWTLIPHTLFLYTKSSLYRRHDALHRTCSDFHTTSLVILLCSTDSNWSLSMNDSSISSSPYFFMVSYTQWVINYHLHNYHQQKMATASSGKEQHSAMSLFPGLPASWNLHNWWMGIYYDLFDSRLNQL